MKTAMTELVIKLKNIDIYHEIFNDNTIKKLLQKEKKQIIQAYKTGMDFTTDKDIKEAKKYFDKTYKCA